MKNLFFLLIFFSAILFCLKYFKYIKKYNNSINLKNYELRKLYVEKYYKQMLFYIEIDLKDKLINPKNILVLKKDIDNISDDINKFYGYLKSIDLIDYENFVKKEKIWLINFIIEFNRTIKKWIQNHKIELEALQKNIDKQIAETRTTSWQSSLTLTNFSLEEHLSELEKIKNSLI